MQGVDHAEFLASLRDIRAEVEKHVGALPRYRALTAIDRTLEEFHGLDDVATPLIALGESLRERLNETAEYRAWNAIRSIGPELTTVLDFLAQRGRGHVSEDQGESPGDVYWSASGPSASDVEPRPVASADNAEMASASVAGHDTLVPGGDDAKSEPFAQRSDEDVEIAVVVTNGKGADVQSHMGLNGARDFRTDAEASTDEASRSEVSSDESLGGWHATAATLADAAGTAGEFKIPPSQVNEFASTRAERPPPTFAESLSQRMAQALVSTPRDASQADERLHAGDSHAEEADPEAMHEAAQTSSKAGRAA